MAPPVVLDATLSDAPVDAAAENDTASDSNSDAPATKISFTLPAKSYVFDAAAWNLPTPGLPAVACGAGQVVVDCCDPPAPLTRPDCSVNTWSCDNTVCTLHIPVSVLQSMDLKKEVPALSSVSDQSLVDVTLGQVRYAFTSTMNLDLPPITFFLAPDAVTASSDPAARRFGTTKPLPAGSTGQNNVDLDPVGAAAFREMARHLGTPFNIVANVTVVVPSGSPVPSGRATLVLQGVATAEF
jgi:hypothetical protein